MQMQELLGPSEYFDLGGCGRVERMGAAELSSNWKSTSPIQRLCHLRFFPRCQPNHFQLRLESGFKALGYGTSVGEQRKKGKALASMVAIPRYLFRSQYSKSVPPSPAVSMALVHLSARSVATGSIDGNPFGILVFGSLGGLQLEHNIRSVLDA